MEKKQIKKGISPSVAAIIGSILTLTGGFFISYNYIQSKKVVAYDYMANVFYEGKEATKEETKEKTEEGTITEETTTKEIKQQEKESATYTDEYIGYLRIPKINLTKGFVDKRSQQNDVEKNILVVAGSNYPDTEKGNLILAGHSGTGWKAFFNELYKVNTNDLVYVSYKNKKYTYKITNIYKQQKVGKIAIYRNYDKTTLTLVTCTNNDSETQTVYISELQTVEDE